MAAPLSGPSTDSDTPLVDVRSLSVSFDASARGLRADRQQVRAVDGVSFTIARGETVALVGESGCGKTTVGRALLALLPATAGSVHFDGVDLFALDQRALRRTRRRLQMVFQDPYASLNPRIRVGEAIREPLRAHKVGTGEEQRHRVEELLDLVGLPANSGYRYPHAFSGGQRQRICIARALALQPEFVIADEPVSALDVSVQAQIVNLFRRLKTQLGLTLLFIAHDLALVRHLADRVIVMYLGKIVETGTRDEVFGNPKHPYTQALLSAVPLPDPVRERARERIVLAGDPPSPVNPPEGCRFHTRCPVAVSICSVTQPVLAPVEPSATVHQAACHLVNATATSLDAA